jgi:Glycosyl transferases group 1
MTFDDDPYPGRPRILFIGFPESSHTHSWINLLEGGNFNVRLFSLPSADPPSDWAVKTYLTRTGAPRCDGPARRTAFPLPESWLSALAKRFRLGGYSTTIEGALAGVIKNWRPDIIHTLGFDPASYFYLRTRKQFGLQGIGHWIAQARGGPDLGLQRYSPEYRPLIEEVFRACDHFIADNESNYAYALTAGLTEKKLNRPGMGVVPGSGGMDVDAMRSMWTLPPSKRERVIVWPKAYELYSSKAMPVFEAILKVWDRIQPCRVEMIWMVQSDVKIWYEKLFPPHIKENCPTFGRLTREETLQRIARARVMMAPSLSDGIPNTMMEAMALGAAPLVSPLDTILPVVKDEENVLFANNLYPDEIANAIVRLMSDDGLVDRMAGNNLVRIRNMADRKRIKEQALAYYEEIATEARSRPSGLRA